MKCKSEHKTESDDKPLAKERKSPGPKPETLKLDGDWRQAVKKSLTKKKPPEGWPK